MADRKVSADIAGDTALAANEEKICRYCFGDENEEGGLISPCECKGGQKYVHLSCLRRWQRMVLVSQSTHPAFQTDDERHYICNVCKGRYSCAPPSRGELMASFTGPEIAALVQEGCIIASRDVFTQMLEEASQQSVLFPRSSSHWIRGVYLITDVTPEKEAELLGLDDPELRDHIVSELDERNRITLQGREFELVSAESLAGIPTDRLRSTLAKLLIPPSVSIVLRSINPISCADDHIGAVNLTHPISIPIQAKARKYVTRAIENCTRKYPGIPQVELIHFSGGPCAPSEIATCIVPGGARRGWTVVKNLEDALVLAHSRGARRYPAQGGIIDVIIINDRMQHIIVFIWILSRYWRRPDYDDCQFSL